MEPGAAVVALVPEQLASESRGRSLYLGWRRIWVAGTLAAAAADVAVDRSVLGSSEVRDEACAAAAAAVETGLAACQTTASDQSVAQLEALAVPIAQAQQVLEPGSEGLFAEHHHDRNEQPPHSRTTPQRSFCPLQLSARTLQ